MTFRGCVLRDILCLRCWHLASAAKRKQPLHTVLSSHHTSLRPGAGGADDGAHLQRGTSGGERVVAVEGLAQAVRELQTLRVSQFRITKKEAIKMATLSASSRTCSTSVARRSAVPQALAPRAPTRPSRAAAVRVQAVKVQPPQGVTLPPQEPQVPPAMFGFVDW